MSDHSNSPQQAGGGFLSNLQIARFLAAFIVMYGHLQFETRDLGLMTSGALVDFKPIYYPAGVDIFFVISGFIMYYLSHNRFGQAGYWRTFVRRRLIRIVPLYWAFLVLMICTIAVFGERMNHAVLDPPHIAASFAFFPWPRFDGNMVPVLSSGWTLNYEMLFYATFAIALTMRRARGLTLVIGTFLAMACIHPLIPAEWFALEFWTEAIILEFVVGIGLAALYLHGVRLSLWQGLAITALGFAMLVFAHQADAVNVVGRFLGAGIPAAVICAGIVLTQPPSQPGRLRRFAILGGDASYSLYLSHPFTVNLLALVWQRAGFDQPYLFFAVALGLCVIVSILIYKLFETPVISFLNGVGKSKTATAAAPIKQF